MSDDRLIKRMSEVHTVIPSDKANDALILEMEMRLNSLENEQAPISQKISAHKTLDMAVPEELVKELDEMWGEIVRLRCGIMAATPESWKGLRPQVGVWFAMVPPEERERPSAGTLALMSIRAELCRLVEIGEDKATSGDYQRWLNATLRWESLTDFAGIGEWESFVDAGRIHDAYALMILAHLEELCRERNPQFLH